jgi:hypothetical protein
VFAGVQKLAYLKDICRSTLLGVYLSSTPTAAMLLPEKVGFSATPPARLGHSSNVGEGEFCDLRL